MPTKHGLVNPVDDPGRTYHMDRSGRAGDGAGVRRSGRPVHRRHRHRHGHRDLDSSTINSLGTTAIDPSDFPDGTTVTPSHPNFDLEFNYTHAHTHTDTENDTDNDTANLHAHSRPPSTPTLGPLPLDPERAVQKAIEIVGKAIEYDTNGEYAVSP